MINGLKMARAMRDAGMPEKQAEALAEALDEGTRETVITEAFLATELSTLRLEIRTDMGNLRTELKTDMAQLSTILTNKMYGIAVGIVVSTGLIQHFVK